MPGTSVGRNLIYGVDSVKSALENLKGRKSTNPMIVSTPWYSSTSFYRDLTEILDSGYSEFKEITHGPPLPEVEHLAEAYRNKECDSIVSVGDASVIRASKLLKYYFAHDAYHLSIPTTLTVSPFSDRAEYRLGDEVLRVADPNIMPDTVILDPMASVETVRSTWATSGLGVMEYALSNLMREDIGQDVEDLLLSSLEGLMVNLPGEGIESRMKCLMSSWYSKEEGYSADLDPLADIKDSLKGVLDLPNELISAVLLPLTAQYCIQKRPKRMSGLASRLGFKGTDTSELSNRSFELIQGLIRKLGVGETLVEQGFDSNHMRTVLRKFSLDDSLIDSVLSSVYSSIS